MTDHGNTGHQSIACFPCIFVIVLCLFPIVHSCISLTSQKPQMGAMTQYNGCTMVCTIKWFDFCLSITLRVIFKWLIKGKRWIIMYES